MDLIVIEPLFVKGEPKEAGEVIKADNKLAAELLTSGRVKPYVSKPDPIDELIEKAPEPPKKRAKKAAKKKAK